MSDEELDQFLGAQATTVVVSGARDTTPWGSVGRFQYDAGHVVIAVAADDPTVQHLEADDRCACILDQFPSYYEIRGVILHGRATRRAEVNGDTTEGDNGIATFDLAVTDVVSYDFGKLTQPPAEGR